MRVSALSFLIAGLAAASPGPGSAESVDDPLAPRARQAFASAAGAVRYEPPVPYSAASAPSDVALADLDADGDMDAVVSCTGFVTVALNRGDGVFVARVDYPAGTVVQTAVADFDGDGRPDLAAANSNETSVTILRNLGGGRFGAGTTIPVGGFLRGIVAADLDHDGDTDLAVCRNGDLRVLANTAGTMSPDLVIPVGYVPRNVAAGDVNADGVPELMTGGEGNDVSVLYRNPDGSYQRQDLGMSIYPITCVVAADLNGDADLDLAGIGSGWVSVRLNQGAGSFDDPTTYEAVPSVKLTAADLDEDGDLDLAVPDGGNNIRLLLNGGNGTFVTQSNVSVPSGARGVAIADLDGSRRDLITGMAPAGFAVLLQTPESRFGMSPLSGAPGATVTLTGPRLSEATSVSLATMPVAFRVLADSVLEATIPTDGRTARFRVFGPDLMAVSDSVFIVAPRISALSPSSRPVASKFMVRGYNFTRTTAVYVNGTAAGFDALADSVIEVEVPFGATEGPVMVTNPGGSDVSDETFHPYPRDSVEFEPAYPNMADREPYSVALADMDRDGDLDAVVTCWFGAVNVAMNRGDGTFAERVSYPVGAALQSAIADLDGDGWLDVAAANNNEGSISILRNSGGGGLENRGVVLLGDFRPHRIGSGDFDGDGDVDLAVVRDSRTEIQILSNTAGRFLPLCSIEVANGAMAIAVGDLDQDGTLELVTGNAESGTVSVLRRVGEALYERTDLRMAPSASAVSIADLNGDGKLDLAAATLAGTTAVRLNLDGVHFAEPTIYSIGMKAQSIDASDLDRDGDLDLAIANYEPSTVSVLMNWGDGTFPTRWDFPTQANPRGIAAGDLDGGGPDLVTANASGTFSTLLNAEGSVSFAPKAGAPGTTVTLSGKTLGTATSVLLSNAPVPFRALGDNVIEVTIPVGARTGRFRVLLPSRSELGDGIFIVAPRINSLFPTRGPIGIRVDIRGHNFRYSSAVQLNSTPTPFQFVSDSLIQVVVTSTMGDGPVTVINPGGSATSQQSFHIAPPESVAFEPPVAHPSPARPVWITLADIDRDGDLDPIVTCAGGALSVMRNQGDGTFTGRVDYPMGEAVSTAVADFDGDGWLDLATTNFGEGYLAILRNLGSGVFGEQVDIYVGGGPWPIVAGDFDRDGDPDLALARHRLRDVHVYANNGGEFTLAGSVPLSQSPLSLTAADIDGDGTLELLVGSGGVSILRRQVDGVYQLTEILPMGAAMVHAADLNGDGALDLASVAYREAAVRLNQGGGHFGDAMLYAIPETAAEALTTTDLDEDGDLDLAIALNGSVSVLMNQGEGVFPTRLDFLTGTYSRAIAAGDLDGGAPDLVTGTLAGTITTLLNQRGGTLSMSPRAGAPGTIVTLTGPGLGAASAVRLGSISVSYRVIDDTHLEIVVPPDARSGRFTVVLPGGATVSEHVFVGIPEIREFTPRVANPGAKVTLLGINLDRVTRVVLGNAPAAFSIVSDSTLIATVPDSARNGRWSVTNIAGERAANAEFHVGPAVTGVNLSWDDCGAAGTEIKSFACDTNSGGDLLVASFSPPAGIDQFIGITADLRVASTFLPDWWKHGTGSCRGVGQLFPRFDNPQSCATGWTGAEVGGFTYVLGAYGSNTARLRVQAALPIDQATQLSAGTEYYAFHVNVARAKTVGSGSCSGCTQPVMFRIESLQLFQPPELQEDPILTAPLERAAAYWQGHIGELPQITSFEPSAGAPGTSVRIEGLRLTAASSVRFGNAEAAHTVDSDTQITATVPGAARTAPVQVTTPFGIASSDSSFVVAPVVHNFLPKQAPVGSSVTIFGYNLATATAVQFGDLAATFSAASDSTIVATVPSGAVDALISITNPGGFAHTDERFRVGPPAGVLNLSWDDCGAAGVAVKTFACNSNSGAPFPMVASFAPPPGVQRLVGLTADLRVSGTQLPDWWTFGCRPASLLVPIFGSAAHACRDYWAGRAFGAVSFTPAFYGPNTGRIRVVATLPQEYAAPVSSDTEYQAFQLNVGRQMTISDGACAGCDREAAIVLERVQLHQPADAHFDPEIVLPFHRNAIFWQGSSRPGPSIDSIDPRAGGFGSEITIRGQEFRDVIGVDFVGSAAAFTVRSDSVVTAIVPASARIGSVTLRTLSGTAIGDIFHPAPHVRTFEPRQAPTNYSPVVIRGFNFTGATRVLFGGIATTYEVVSDSAIRATVPPAATSGPITIEGPGGSGSSDVDFAIGPVPSGAINLSWNNCGTLGTQFTTFACNSQSGSPFEVVGSFVPPPGVNELVGLTAEVRVIGFSNLPDWWKHGASGCREPQALTVSTDFRNGPSGCGDFFAGRAQSTVTYDVGVDGPNTARISITAGMTPDKSGPVTPDTEYYGFRIVVSRSNSHGCSGCNVPVSLELRQIQLIQPPAASFDPILTAPHDHVTVHWQGTPGDPPDVQSIAPTAGPPASEVAIAGIRFTGVNSVKLGQRNAEYRVESDSLIIATVPIAGRSGRFRVSSPNGSDSSEVFIVSPEVRYVVPAQAPAGSSVAMRGGNFTSVTMVAFNDVETAFTIVSDSLLRADVPAQASGGSIVVRNPSGTAAIPFQVGPLRTGSLNLSWDDCGLAGAEFASFACDAYADTGFALVASFAAGDALPEVVGLSAELRVATTDALPDWWKHGAGQCRENDGLHLSFGSPSMPSGCQDPWAGVAVGTLSYEIAWSGPNTARMLVTAAPQTPRAVAANIEYRAFEVEIDRTHLFGFGACSGCARAAAITLHELKLLQSTDLAHDPLLTAPRDRAVAYWQAVPGPLPRITRLEPTAGAPGDSVTIFGDHFTDGLAVHFGSLASAYVVTTDSTVRTSVPDGGRTGHVSIFTRQGDAASESLFIVAPRITSFIPRQAPEGHAVLVRGANMGHVTQVAFNGTLATFELVSDTLLRATVPSGVTTGPISVSNAGGTSVSGVDFTPGPLIPGSINLSWNDCGAAGTELATFACDANREDPIELVASFVPPTGVDELIAFSAALRITTAFELPDWWKHGGLCRGAGDLSVTTDFTESQRTCEDPWAGRATSQFTYSVGYLGPTTARLAVSSQIPTPVAVEPGVEHYAFIVRVKPTMVLPTGPCPGCAIPAAIALDYVELLQPPELDSNHRITTALGRSVAYWQGVPTPPRIISFAPAGGEAGTAVTLLGERFSSVHSVRFGELEATFTVVSDSVITTQVPAGAKAASIVVRGSNGIGVSENVFAIRPTLLGFFPPQAPVAATVSITGLHFTAMRSVEFNGTPATFEVKSDSLIEARVPAAATDGPITVTNNAGSSVSSSSFRVGPPIAPGINLSWDDCGEYGTDLKSFACDDEVGAPFRLVGSFRPPDDLPEYLGMMAQVDVQTIANEIPDWWKHCHDLCRGITGLSTNFDFTTGPSRCEDAFGGEATGGWVFDENGPSNRARFRLSAAVPLESRRTVLAGREYYAFEILVKREKSTGSNACSGCETPACIVLNQLVLLQPLGRSSDVPMTDPALRNYVHWQAPMTGCPLVTAVQVSLVSAEATPGRVRLVWHTAKMERMIVHRRQEGGDWRAIATRMPDGQGRIEFEDVEVQPGATYEYGLGERVGAATLGWARVTVPQPAPPSLALNRVAWLSSARALSIALSLPSAEPAAIELYDVNGRRLGRESLALPQGSHDLQLSLRHLIRPGVFFAHLKQGRHGVSQRFVVIE